MDSNKVGQFIQKLRKEKKMTQKELAEQLFVTDKAVSKWERGLSFPDITMLNSLAQILEVDVSELLNGEMENTQDNNKQMEKQKREKKVVVVKKTVFILAWVIFLCSLFLQIFYWLVLWRKGIFYAMDSLFYIINQLLILSGMIAGGMTFKKKGRILIIILGILATMGNVKGFFEDGLQYQSTIAFSKDGSLGIIAKRNKKTGDTTLYRSYYLLFAQKKESLPYVTDGKIKLQFLENDACSVIFQDKEGKLREYISTYGNRSERENYYSVVSGIRGQWSVGFKTGFEINMIADEKGITLSYDQREKELFSRENIRQYGTIAIALYQNDVPKYHITLDQNCHLDQPTMIFKEGCTISLTEVNINKTKKYTLECMTDKSKLSEGQYHLVSLERYHYQIKNDILYIRYDDANVLSVPGHFNENTIRASGYQIKDDKTFFVESDHGKRYLVTSDDKGATWQRYLLAENNAGIQSLQFLDQHHGYMILLLDAAMTTAYGNIKRTDDGGKTWTVISDGIDHHFRLSSELYFVNREAGFLTMPRNGESCSLYVTQDGGKTFRLVQVPTKDISDSALTWEEIYDYFMLPKKENGILTLSVGQGSDGDYDGGLIQKYHSYDNGRTWVFAP